MLEPNEFIRQYFSISDNTTIYEELGDSISIDKLIELMRSYKEKLETIAQQSLPGSEAKASTQKSVNHDYLICGYCGKKLHYDITDDECPYCKMDVNYRED